MKKHAVEVITRLGTPSVVKVVGPDDSPNARNGELRTVYVYPDSDSDKRLLAGAILQLVETEKRYARLKLMTEKQFTVWRRTSGAADSAIDDLIEADQLESGS